MGATSDEGVAVPDASLTTQQAQPGRASRRTLVQTAVGYLIVFGAVAPAVITIAGEQLEGVLSPEWYAWVLGAGATVTAISGLIARIMAIPAVDSWLQKVHLASSPEVRPR
jgi:hypothetical protein